MQNLTVDLSLIKPCLLVVMGVSGCGKSKLAKGLQEKLGWPFQEGDNLHSEHNVKKMSEGVPLTDEDRIPWLEKCHKWLERNDLNHQGAGILTCSALKRSYRDILRHNIQSPLYFLYINVPADILLKRLKKRKNHFMPASLLSSQLETLEPPQPGEPFIEIHVKEEPFEDVLQKMLYQLQQHSLKASG